MPAHFGRLPRMVGVPAGGSLTADQWLLLATVVAPLAVRTSVHLARASTESHTLQIPRIWEAYMGDPDEARARRAAVIQSREAKAHRLAEEKARVRAEKEVAKKAAKVAAAALKQAEKDARRMTAAGVTMATALPVLNTSAAVDTASSVSGPAPATSGTASASTSRGQTSAPKVGKRKRQEAPEDDAEVEDLPSTLHPDDPANFLKLCEAIRVLLSPTLTDADINKSDGLLREYCTELITVCMTVFYLSTLSLIYPV